jgi:hypothetical protein
MSTPEELVLSYGESLYRDFVPHNIGYVFYGELKYPPLFIHA